MPSTTPGAQLDLPALQQALARTPDDDSLALVTPSEKLKRKKRGSQRQACACGKGVRGICRGRDAKPTLSGITLPFGKEGSVNYRLREQQLRAVMGASEFAKNKLATVEVVRTRVSSCTCYTACTFTAHCLYTPCTDSEL